MSYVNGAEGGRTLDLLDAIDIWGQAKKPENPCVFSILAAFRSSCKRCRQVPFLIAPRGMCRRNPAVYRPAIASRVKWGLGFVRRLPLGDWTDSCVADELVFWRLLVGNWLLIFWLLLFVLIRGSFFRSVSMQVGSQEGEYDCDQSRRTENTAPDRAGRRWS